MPLHQPRRPRIPGRQRAAPRVGQIVPSDQAAAARCSLHPARLLSLQPGAQQIMNRWW